MSGALTRERELLRLATAGSVDDGKSTLIGRLLLDTGSLLADHSTTSRRRCRARPRHVTDGLRAEREQGITIDVAYRFFSTERRSFILADTPGHERYTRNMFTGASTADVALVLVDARSGVVTQTRRHAHIAALLGIGHMVVCVNKMDLVGWDQRALRRDRAIRCTTSSDASTSSDLTHRPDQRAARRQRRVAPTARRSTTGRRCWSTSRRSTSRPIATSTVCGSRSSGWAAHADDDRAVRRADRRRDARRRR